MMIDVGATPEVPITSELLPVRAWVRVNVPPAAKVIVVVDGREVSGVGHIADGPRPMLGKFNPVALRSRSAPVIITDGDEARGRRVDLRGDKVVEVLDGGAGQTQVPRGPIFTF